MPTAIRCRRRRLVCCTCRSHPPSRAASPSVLTDDDGRVTVERLDPEATYVLQFQGRRPIIVDGKDAGFKPIQFADDQNAGRELNRPSDLPGFPVHLGGQTDATLRFVIGGTFSEGEIGRRRADVRPGRERRRAGAPGQPAHRRRDDARAGAHLSRRDRRAVGRRARRRGIVRAAGQRTRHLARSPVSRRCRCRARPPAEPPARVRRQRQGSSPVTLVLVATIVLLAAVIGVLLLRQRRRPG